MVSDAASHHGFLQGTSAMPMLGTTEFVGEGEVAGGL